MEDLSMMKREICVLEQNLEACKEKNEVLEKIVEELTKKNNQLARDITSIKWQRDEIDKRLYKQIGYYIQLNIDAKRHELSCPYLQGKNKWRQWKKRWFHRCKVGQSPGINED